MITKVHGHCEFMHNASFSGLFSLKLKYDKPRGSSTWCAVKAHLHPLTFLFCLIKMGMANLHI